MDVGVIVGRFQVDELHAGHKALLEYVSARHPNITIFLGVPPLEGTTKDPLSYQVREQMLRSYMGNATVLPLYDVQSDDDWSHNLDGIIGKLYFSSKVTLYSGPDGFKGHYSGKFPVEQVKILDDVPKWNGTDIRRRIGDAPIHQQAFRAGIIHASQRPYMNTKMCADIAAIRREKEAVMVLMGWKQGEQGWRFPGGLLEPGDRDLEHVARRELLEETTLTCEGPIEYLGSFPIEDWRMIGTGIGCFTAFFMVTETMGGAKAGDDLDDVKWFFLNDDSFPIQPEHETLFKRLREEFGCESHSSD